LTIYDNNGIASNNFVGLGISGSNYSNNTWTISGASDAYLYTGNSDLVIGTQTNGNYISFFTDGTLITNERLRISGNTVTVNNGILFSAPTVNTDTSYYTVLVQKVPSGDFGSTSTTYDSFGVTTSYDILYDCNAPGPITIFDANV
jgi:hypothetical protein